MDVADIIVQNGTEPAMRDRVFILFRDDSEMLKTLTYAEFYELSLAYGNMLKGMKQSLKIGEKDRFHVGVFMQNIPEFFFLLGGCAFTNATLVGVNNAQVGEKLAFDINNIDMHVLFVDHAGQPGTGGTFLDTVLFAKEIFGFTGLTEDFIFATGTPQKTKQPPIKTISQKLHDSSKSIATFRPCPFDPSRAAVFICTSVTTGAPRASR